MSTRLFVCAVAFVLSLPVTWASPVPPCLPGTLSSYIALGGGCFIDDKIFSGFTYSSVFDDGPTADQVNVTPVNDVYNPGFTFATAPGSPWHPRPSPNVNLYNFRFTVTVQPGGNLIKDASLVQGNSSIAGDGAARVAEQVCLGGMYVDTGSGLKCSTGDANDRFMNTTVSATTSDASDNISFSPVSLLDVHKVVRMESNQTGSATTLDSFTERFSEVPEPGMLPALTCLIALGIRLRT